MRSPTPSRLAAFVVGLGLLPLAGLSLAGDGAAPPAKSPFTVHEWGTFTSVQGADGVGLEGLAHEEEALPEFVYSRTKVRDCPLRAQGYKGLEQPAQHVTQKMETPVLYFHTGEPRRVRARVDFVKGLITQWYPVTDLLGPPEGACDAGPIDVSKVERSFLEWEVDLLPRTGPAPTEIPSVGEGRSVGVRARRGRRVGADRAAEGPGARGADGGRALPLLPRARRVHAADDRDGGCRRDSCPSTTAARTRCRSWSRSR